MKRSYLRACAWSGPVCAFLWIIGLLFFARFIPPPSPQESAPEIATFFAGNAVGIRWGMVLLLIGGVLYLPWVAVIAVQMKRIEGRQSPLTYVQFGLGTLFVLLFVLAAIFWQTAAYRPLEDVVFTQRFNDMGWFMFLSPVPIVTVQGLALSLVVLGDRSERLFPRWFGWFNLWAQLVFLPGTVIPLFKAGPVTWNGAIGLWIPAVAFTVWMCLVTWALLRAVAVPDADADADADVEVGAGEDASSAFGAMA
ncbi:hypothetical protein [Actinomycetospora sp. TBRC 11914]|uniref:hypothetical protein n=1 Tax=Actinomycetospora sp. TBRC 11914 TaxID=2729387 RepID=UPI00145E9FDB|nr:hypothetical protein [Actinomycetospora sp. TBRC 11914]NMO91677.1 hypothetical protein [Actinomycetospora sp. TBRC 11914]